MQEGEHVVARTQPGESRSDLPTRGTWVMLTFATICDSSGKERREHRNRVRRRSGKSCKVCDFPFPTAIVPCHDSNFQKFTHETPYKNVDLHFESKCKFSTKTLLTYRTRKHIKNRGSEKQERGEIEKVKTENKIHWLRQSAKQTAIQDKQWTSSLFLLAFLSSFLSFLLTRLCSTIIK